METRQANGTLEFFRINRNPRLVRARIGKQAEAEAEVAAGDVSKVQELAIRFQPLSLVARQILLEAGKRLPDEDRELNWLTRELCKGLLVALRLSRTYPGDGAIERDARELRWGLAVLCSQPPVGNAATAIDTVTRLGLMSSVSPFVAKL